MASFEIVNWTDLAGRALASVADSVQAVQVDGKWAFGESFTMQRFKKAVSRFVDAWESSEVDPGTDARPVYTVVVAPCRPADSLLLAAQDKAIPEKLARMVVSPEKPVWTLKEKDIDVDMVAFNAACTEILWERFRQCRKQNRIVYIRHSKLDVQELSRCVFELYGRSACRIATRPAFQPLVDLNCLVARYCSRARARELPEYKLAAEEAKQMVDKARRTAYG